MSIKSISITRKTGIILFTLIMGAILVVDLYIYFFYNPTPKIPKELPHTIATSEGKENIVNVLFVGYGGAGHPGGGLADAIVLASANLDTKVVKLIAIPRDTWVGRKINDAFAESPQALKQEVATVTGIGADYYVSINFGNFTSAVDNLGGLTVDVPVAFTDEYFPVPGREELLCDFTPEEMVEIHAKFTGFELEKQFKCRYETLTFQKGPQQMNGETALKFVRSRHSAEHGNDFARGEREQAVLVALKDKLISLKALDDAFDFIKDHKNYVGTDFPLDKDLVKFLVNLIEDPKAYKVVKVNIDDALLDGRINNAGQYALIPKAGEGNFREIQNFIKNSN